MKAQVVEGGPLQYVLVRPEGFEPDGSWPLLIILHGFGASMYDLASIAGALDPSGYVYAFPNAPFEVDLGGGIGYSWSADRPGVIPTSNDGASVDEKLDSCIAELLEATSVAPGRAILGGFSQGAGVTLRFGLPRPDVFAGLVALSGFFRDADALRDQLPAQRAQPIFMAHGRQDPIVPIEHAYQTKSFLENAGYAPEYHEYDMPHTVSEEVLQDLVPWLHKTLPPKS